MLNKNSYFKIAFLSLISLFSCAKADIYNVFGLEHIRDFFSEETKCEIVKQALKSEPFPFTRYLKKEFKIDNPSGDILMATFNKNDSSSSDKADSEYIYIKGYRNSDSKAAYCHLWETTIYSPISLDDDKSLNKTAGIVSTIAEPKTDMAGIYDKNYWNKIVSSMDTTQNPEESYYILSSLCSIRHGGSDLRAVSVLCKNAEESNWSIYDSINIPGAGIPPLRERTSHGQLASDPIGKLVAAVGKDRKVLHIFKSFGCNHFVKVTSITHDSEIHSARFNDVQDSIVTVTDDNTVRVWEFLYNNNISQHIPGKVISFEQYLFLNLLNNQYKKHGVVSIEKLIQEYGQELSENLENKTQEDIEKYLNDIFQSFGDIVTVELIRRYEIQDYSNLLSKNVDLVNLQTKYAVRKMEMNPDKAYWLGFASGALTQLSLQLAIGYVIPELATWPYRDYSFTQEYILAAALNLGVGQIATQLVTRSATNRDKLFVLYRKFMRSINR